MIDTLCDGCAVTVLPDDSSCWYCGQFLAPPQPARPGRRVPPSVPTGTGSVGSAASDGRDVRSARRLWWLPALLATLIVAGGYLPLIAGAPGHVAHNATGTSMVLGFAAIAALAAIDTYRGNGVGLSAAAGVGVLMAVLVGAVVALAYAFTRRLAAFTHTARALSLGGGSWCWLGAGLCGLALIRPGARAVANTRRHTLIPGRLAAGIGLSGAVLVIGLCIPPTGGMSVSKHLFGINDLWVNASVVAFLVVISAASAIAAFARSVGAVMLSLGVGGFWLVAWAINNAGFGSGGPSSVSFISGQFGAVTAGLSGLIGFSALGLLLTRDDRRLRVPILAPVALAAAVILVPAGVAHHYHATVAAAARSRPAPLPEAPRVNRPLKPGKTGGGTQTVDRSNKATKETLGVGTNRS